MANIHLLSHHVVFQDFLARWEDPVLFCCLVWQDMLLYLHLSHTQYVGKGERWEVQPRKHHAIQILKLAQKNLTNIIQLQDTITALSDT